MPNRLQYENSPYLLQHKDNPVDWYPWGEEALQKAKEENKLIFLSIGYAACHWCHVMAHESFENQTTADILNKDFISIKVDREERPDLDHIYMTAVVTMTKSGGWPMSVFLTPDGKPFYGGTYFPPVPRYDIPSFNEILTAVAEAWRTKPDEVLVSGDELTKILFEQPREQPQEAVPSKENLAALTAKFSESYDWKFGGWERAPKFPHPLRLIFLLEQAAGGDTTAQKMALHALDAMAQGGMFDVVGGGFARYSTDARWLVPHFEKMLYDNALLARAYLYAYLLTKNPVYRKVCERTLDFVLREITDTEGGFYSSIDADSEGVEGKFYVWTSDEIDHALPHEDHNLFARTLYHIPVTGNWEGSVVLQQMNSMAETARYMHLTPDEFDQVYEHVHEALYNYRAQRIAPHIDDKVLTGWNALMLQALAEAALYLDRPDYLQAAQRNADFLLENLMKDSSLLRSWRQGSAKHNAFLEDYAGLGIALLALYQSDFDQRWYIAAQDLTERMLPRFFVEGEGFYDSMAGDDLLIARARNNHDSAEPCGSSQAVNLLLLMSAYEGSSHWVSVAEQALTSEWDFIQRFPTACANWLSGYRRLVTPGREVAIVGSMQDDLTRQYLREIRSQWRPDVVIAVGEDNGDETPTLLQQRTQIDGKPTVYVCRNHACQSPVNSVDELRQLLAEMD